MVVLRRTHLLRAFTIVVVFLISLYFFMYSHMFEKLAKRLTLTRLRIIQTETKTVLFWTKFFGVEDYYVGLDLPEYRDPQQRWIFFLLESPAYSSVLNEETKDVFNWTMTYRTDSDIYMPYQGNVPPWNESKAEEFHQMLRGKRKIAAWFVSHCVTLSQREKYVEELRKHVDVDVYGKCGTLKCANNQCLEMLSPDYKFYLAFENSLCCDYVTEKFFNALANNVVPVVYGGANYSLLAPSKSFIDVHDFASPKLLADYLKYLDANQTAYEEYFHWRKTYTPKFYSAWCRLCEKLHSPSLPARNYDDIYKWWMLDSHCGENMAVNASRLHRRVLTSTDELSMTDVSI